MSGDAIINLKNVQESFFDKLDTFEKAIQRDPLSPLEVAQLRLNIIKDAEQAIENNDSPEAKRWYGSCCITGEHGFPFNIEYGIKILNEAVIARAAGAHEVLGDVYSGVYNTVPQEYLDIDKAIKHYESADNGYCYYRLACIYYSDPQVKDLRTAIDYCDKSAHHLGHSMGKCLWATWLYFGEWIAQDTKAAYDLFKEVHQETVSDNGEFTSWEAATAHFFIGVMTYYGEHVQQEEHRGFIMIEDAAKYGDGYANDWLDNHYR